MIGLTNEKRHLTRDERRTIVSRALQSRPRLIKFESEFLAGEQEHIKRSQVGVDYDTYIVSANFNSSAWFGLTGTDRIFLQMYSMYKRSLYRYNQENLTLSSFVTYDARRRTSLLDPFDDRQREFMPFLVRAQDTLVVETTNDIIPAQNIKTCAILAGFMVTPQDVYPADVFAMLERSLDREVRFETFDIEVDHTGKKTYRIQNDGFPRLLLGFGVVGANDVAPPVVNLQSNVLITDITRRLKFSEEPIPLESFAPRMPMTTDQHIYYLPVEYYFEPFATLTFEIENDIDAPYVLTAHTRTV